MGITITAVLTSSTCISPILAEDEIIAVAEAENFAATAGLQPGTVIYLPKDVKEQISKPYTYYTIENGKQVPVNLEAVVEGSTASYDTLNLFFYVAGDVVVYVTV